MHDDVERRRLFQHVLRAYHYLGHGQHVGENVGYLAVDGSDRPLGCLLFGAPAWKVSSRARFICMCCRAANWRLLGQTTERTRQDRKRRIRVPRKGTYVYVLKRRFREVLRR